MNRDTYGYGPHEADRDHDGPDHGPANDHDGPDEADHGPASLPMVWDEAEHANWLYDVLSEALRDHADAFPDVDAAFSSLDEWLRTGGMLPGPWRNAARPDAADD